MQQPIITLTTDWGYQDFFAGMVKGKLLRLVPGVQIIDITHGIAKFDITKALFVVKNACLDFPAGTIHIVDVNTVETSGEAFVVVRYSDQYYICTDNGLPAAVFGNECDEAVTIDAARTETFRNFASFDLFCHVASLLAQGAPLSQIGAPLERFKSYTPMGCIEGTNSLTAHVVYIDDYGNGYLDITYSHFQEIAQGRPFTMTLRNIEEEKLSQIVTSYHDSGERHLSGELLLTVSATGHLQLAAKQDSAATLYGLKNHMSIQFAFRDIE